MRTSPETRKCGNCHYWNGERSTTIDEHGQLKVIIRSQLGECENGDSNFVGKMRAKGDKCVRFYKWSDLYN